MTPPVPAARYRSHHGQDIAAELAFIYVRNPGEEPQWSEMGALTPVWLYSRLVALRMRLEAT